MAERDKEIMSNVKQKPTICKKSISLLGLKLKLRQQYLDGEAQDFCKDQNNCDASTGQGFVHNH